MAESENVAKLKEGYQFWNDSKAGSVQYWLDLMADDVTWRSLSRGAPGMEFSKDCNGKVEVQHYFERLAQDWEMIHFTTDEFIAQEDRVVVLSQCTWRSKLTGKSVESPKADIFRFRDGKISEFFEFYDSARAIEASKSD